MPEWFAALAPDGMLLAVTLMLWAHLQELTNHRFCKGYHLKNDPSEVTVINNENIAGLLLSPNIILYRNNGKDDNAGESNDVRKRCLTW